MLNKANISAEDLQKAQNSKSLTSSASAFLTGLRFTITDYSYEPIDNSKNLFPAFVTSLGPLSVNSLRRPIPIKPYLDKTTNEMVFARQPKGELTDLINKILAENRGKTNDEVLPILVNACKDKTFVVRQVEYVTRETQFGDRSIALLHIDIVHD